MSHVTYAGERSRAFERERVGGGGGERGPGRGKERGREGGREGEREREPGTISCRWW